MKNPRIYLYKVTFEEIPDWYWGIHKERNFEDGYLGSPETHAWKWDFYTPYLQICQTFDYSDEGWNKAQNIEKRVIKPDLNNPLCLNEHCGGIISIGAMSKGGKRGAEKTNAERDERGKSKNAVKGGKNGATKTNAEKNEEGKSKNPVKGGKKRMEAAHTEKNEKGQSVFSVKASKASHAEKDENGKSKNAVKNGQAAHTEKDVNGKSKNAVKGGKASHSEKDEQGRSLRGVENMERINSQIWESTEDGFRGRACSVVLHNKSKGWDPNARVKVS
jgi:hypothetical protein